MLMGVVVQRHHSIICSTTPLCSSARVLGHEPVMCCAALQRSSWRHLGRSRLGGSMSRPYNAWSASTSRCAALCSLWHWPAAWRRSCLWHWSPMWRWVQAACRQCCQHGLMHYSRSWHVRHSPRVLCLSQMTGLRSAVGCKGQLYQVPMGM